MRAEKEESESLSSPKNFGKFMLHGSTQLVSLNKNYINSTEKSVINTYI